MSTPGPTPARAPAPAPAPAIIPVPGPAPAAAGSLTPFAERPLFRVFAYYVLLFAGTAALIQLWPDALSFINAPLPVSSFLPNGMGHEAAPQFAGGEAPGPWHVVLATVIALASACLLMVPVTWIYVQTRRKKGFRQSVVQTLIILPLVVAGVILLVQNSTALAFSLGGIVGAVSFRNTLRDTKDTIYIFLAIVVGLSAGVHAMLVAATISVSFNIVALIMWWTDFGRVGAELEGGPAERRLARAKAMADRSGGFISMVDRELLQSMTPEQLDVLAGRARLRQHAANEEADLGTMVKPKRDRTLRLAITGPTATARRAVEAALEANTKRWEFIKSSSNGPGTAMLEYELRLKKSADPADFLGRFRAAAGAVVEKADLDG
jgi:hypothetical protein